MTEISNVHTTDTYRSMSATNNKVTVTSKVYRTKDGGYHATEDQQIAELKHRVEQLS